MRNSSSRGREERSVEGVMLLRLSRSLVMAYAGSLSVEFFTMNVTLLLKSCDTTPEKAKRRWIQVRVDRSIFQLTDWTITIILR